MRRFLTSALAAIVLAGVASACINDSELPGHEREFRSTYNRQAAPEPPKETPYIPAKSVPIALFGGGGLLMVGAVVFAVRKPLAKG
jgi:hypothetical protein